MVGDCQSAVAVMAKRKAAVVPSGTAEHIKPASNICGQGEVSWRSGSRRVSLTCHGGPVLARPVRLAGVINAASATCGLGVIPEGSHRQRWPCQRRLIAIAQAARMPTRTSNLASNLVALLMYVKLSSPVTHLNRRD